MLLDSDGLYVRGVWFNNQPRMIRKFRGRRSRPVLRQAETKRGPLGICQPPRSMARGCRDAEPGDAHGGLLPRYGLTEGLSQGQMRRIVREVVEHFAELVPDPFPAEFASPARTVPDCGRPIRGLHFAQSLAEYEPGRRRLIFDDLFEFQLGLALAAAQLEDARRRPPCCRRRPRSTPASAGCFRSSSPRDRTRPSREICGRHGSARCHAPAAARRRGARQNGGGGLRHAAGGGATAIRRCFMAPDRSARQPALARRSTGMLAAKPRPPAAAHRRVDAARTAARLWHGSPTGECRLVVGTQAIIQEDVAFAKLGLVVIDEQHKFGVRAAGRCSKQAGLDPHVLVMTATPIPGACA